MTNNLKRAIDTDLGGLRTTQRERAMIFVSALEGKKVKKKLSVAFVLTIILVLLAAGALAALLSSKEFVNQIMAPLAVKDSSQKWTSEQTDEIIRLAEENGLTITDEIRKHLDGVDGTYKEELMRAFAKIDLGFYPASWSIEDQAWYDELLVKCGLKDERTRFMPAGNEISETQAVEAAIAYTNAQFRPNVNLTDESLYTRYAQYMLSEDSAGMSCKIWDIEYEAKDASNPSYYIIVSSDGIVNTQESYLKKQTGMSLSDKIPPAAATSLEQLRTLIEQDDFFTVENLASFSSTHGEMIKAAGDTLPSQYRILRALCGIPYGRPSSADISQEKALEVAKKEALGPAGWSEEWWSRCKYTVSYRVYDPQKPEWRVCYKIARVEDYVLATNKVMPFGIVVYIDARSGNILSINELHEQDFYYWWCEFPDERDTIQTIPHGLG